MLSLSIISLDKQLFHGPVKSISVPTPNGHITILPNHEPLITTLTAGEVILTVNEGEGIYSPDKIFIAISGGFLECKPGSTVSIIADSALRVDDIDEKKVEEAKQKAEIAMQEYREGKQKLSEEEYATLAGQLAKTLAELKVARRKKG